MIPNYKVWDKEENQMYELASLNFPLFSSSGKDLSVVSKEDTEVSEWRSMDQVKLLQYIGILDMNKNEMCEGDVIKITYDTAWSDNEFEYYEVKYCDYEDYPAFDLKPWIDCEMNSLSWLKSESDPSVIKYEVVGNVYENPELFNEFKS